MSSLVIYSKCYKIPDNVKTKGDRAFKSVNEIFEDERFTSKQTKKNRGWQADKKDLITKDLFNPVQLGVLRGTHSALGEGRGNLHPISCLFFFEN